MFENVIIGKLLVSPEHLFARDMEDWETVKQPKTLFTEERNLARIMKEAGIVDSIGEVRRNQPKLNVMLERPDFFTVKWGKKFLFVAVGE